ncbi:MAG: hypothetical protein KDE27_30285 [Planctomycetes bacterium]|nr:hypothetical protein [Planctomycetota bacterium]
MLHDVQGDPAAAAAELALERDRVAGDEPVAHELVAAELRWIRRQQDVRAAARATSASEDELRVAVAAAEREWLELRVRALVDGADRNPAAWFDLAEIQAEATRLGLDAVAAEARAAIGRSVASGEIDARVREEAAERVAALLAADDEAPLRDQILTLRANAELLAALADRGADRTLRRHARRLRNLADDRELALRLERTLGRRGVVVFETANVVLLLVVLAILTIEFTVDLSPAVGIALQWIDALACLFFIFAFFFELALHPRRGSWFVRNVLVDLLPAIPSALFLLPSVAVPGVAEDAVVIRALRVLRITWAARYVQMLRPIVRSLRLLLFLVRGMDGLVLRFAKLLDREFVFLPAAADEQRAIAEDESRELLFEALGRERELLDLLSGAERRAALAQRARHVQRRLTELGALRAGSLRLGSSRRDIAIERAIEVLWSLRVSDVGRFLRPSDVAALDRVLRVVSAAPVRWLPVVRRFSVHPLAPTPEERVVALARRLADWLEGWHRRLLFHADLHGIVTGPQILDRVATAMVKATQRPAVRLLLFGGLFLLFDMVFGWIPEIVNKIVATPLIVLGSICLVGLAVGRWLKAIAGEAADAYRMTSEAHFLPQLELAKLRYEAVDLAFLARRVFEPDESDQALELLREQIRSARAGVPVARDGVDEHVRFAANRVAMLYLHFLDGAPLHITDVKTTEQLLANKAIENLRERFLGVSRRDRKRLRRLRLDDGSVFSGPYLWFSFITESIAVETAKRIEGYNRYCIPLAEVDAAQPEQRAAMADWLLRRRDPKGGRTLAAADSARTDPYPTTEFCAIDFVGADAERDRHIAAIFGREVLEVLVRDRRTMIREIFGTRPMHHLPKSERSFNPLRLYRVRMSHGRVLLAPLLMLWRVCRFVGWLVTRVRQIVREVLDPELAMRRREIGLAPFAVALRKIHRMKAPGLREALRMRLALDPVYAGASAGWSEGAVETPPGEPDAEPEFARDLAFLHLHERESVELRDRAEEIRRAVRELHTVVATLSAFPPVVDDAARRGGELAVTSAWITDLDDIRTLWSAERWHAEQLPPMLAGGVPGTFVGDAWRALLGAFRDDVIDRWLRDHGGGLGRSARRMLARAWARNHAGIREVLQAWCTLPPGASPSEAAAARLVGIYRQGPAVRRDIRALRAIQSLAVLDVRNYRDLVFDLGGYADDGEDASAWSELP